MVRCSDWCVFLVDNKLLVLVFWQGLCSKMRGGAGVKLLSYCDGEAPGGRSLCVLNCHKVMEGHPRSSAQLPRQIHNQQIRPGRAQSKCEYKIQIQLTVISAITPPPHFYRKYAPPFSEGSFLKILW